MQPEVLLVEDNPGDVRLTREAFRESEVTARLHVVTDGLEAVRFLKHEGAYAAAPRPDLILLDLNLPRLDGREVLGRIKLDADLKSIPTVVLTTSSAEVDIAKSYELQANCCLVKPSAFQALVCLVRSLDELWLKNARPLHRAGG